MAAESPAFHRLFFALWPPFDVVKQLHDAASAAQAHCGGRLMRRDSLHMTLAFLGSVSAPRVTDAEAAADGVTATAFDLAVDRLGYWKRKRIVWAGSAAGTAALVDLAGDLARQLRAVGFVLEDRPFAAHVTLLRNADCRESPDIGDVIDWPVADFALIESYPDVDGSRYAVRRRWPLSID